MASTLSPVSMPLAFISSMARSRASLRPDANPAWRIAHGEYPHRGLDMRQIGPGLGQLHFAQLYRSGDFSALPFQRRHGTDIRHGTGQFPSFASVSWALHKFVKALQNEDYGLVDDCLSLLHFVSGC